MRVVVDRQGDRVAGASVQFDDVVILLDADLGVVGVLHQIRDDHVLGLAADLASKYWAFANIAPTFGLARMTVGAPAWELLLPNLVNYMQPWLGTAEVRSIAAHDGHIYFGGNFFISSDIMVMGTHVGRWDGVDQVVELAAPDQPTTSVVVREGRLIIGGAFSVWRPYAATLDLSTGTREEMHLAPMTVFPQPASTDPTTSGLKPFWSKNGTAIALSRPSGQR